MKLFRVEFYDTKSDNKYDGDLHEYLCDNRNAAWHLWYNLKLYANAKHVDVYNLHGIKQEPEKGVNYLSF